MKRINKTIGTNYVLAAMILVYLAQISAVPGSVIEQWTLHDWVRASLFVILAGIKAWNTFLTNPEQAAADFAGSISSVRSTPAPQIVNSAAVEVTPINPSLPPNPNP